MIRWAKAHIRVRFALSIVFIPASYQGDLKTKVVSLLRSIYSQLLLGNWLKNNSMDEDNRVPIIIGNASPFRIIVRDTDCWTPTLEDTNNGTYDYIKLHRLSTYIDVDIRPYSMGVAFDGSLILPAAKEFHDKDKSLDIFNRTLGYLLLGGIYTEAVSPEDMTVGSMTLDGYFRPTTSSSGAVASFHRAIQTKHLGALDSIKLLNPEEIKIEDYQNAIESGKATLSAIPRLSASILLNGATQYVKHEWPESLVSLWTSIEQVLSHIWDAEIVRKRNDFGQEITGRKKFLQDFRTWSTSAKIEVLYQNTLIDPEVYGLLNNARKSRNTFVHEGIKPTQENARSALDSLFALISFACNNFEDKSSLNNIVEMIEKHLRGELIPKNRIFSKEEVTHWLPVPPIPGDTSWGDEEYEIIEELKLKKLTD